MALLVAVIALAMATSSIYAGFLPGQGLLPAGNLRSVDNGGPYHLSLLDVQANEVKEAIAAKEDFTDADLIDFLVNVECFEGLFDTWGVFGRGFNGDLEKGGPKPIGAKAANLTDETRMFMAEVALNEQGHALFTRQAGGAHACPPVDFTGGWNKWMAAAFDLGDKTIKETYGEDFDPFLNDQNFVLCVTILEELGATGNKGLVSMITNPVLANGVAGLATAATAQAAVERFVLWNMRHKIVHPFGETVQQVFARASALRDSLDGPVIHDQGLVNTDPRFIAVPFGGINLIPTDIRGLTFDRTPQQNINILTLGNPEGKGVFFPSGIPGRLNKPTGFDKVASGLDEITVLAKMAGQETVEEVGAIPPPLKGAEPATVPAYDALTQGIEGVRDDGTYKTRGYVTTPTGPAHFDKNVVVAVAPRKTGGVFNSISEGVKRVFGGGSGATGDEGDTEL